MYYLFNYCIICVCLYFYLCFCVYNFYNYEVKGVVFDIMGLYGIC